ncbi:MAG: glycine cleavage system protein H, partial [Clostridia bacterium]|nr:glycine cleavage system protein H [Clostridia bacterium]
MSQLTYPEDRRYHADHLWAKALDDGSFVIGITAFAQDQLGEVIFIDLPEEGAHFDQGVSCAEIESAKVVSPAIIPLSGTVVAV